jgi:hypothetical protein
MNPPPAAFARAAPGKALFCFVFRYQTYLDMAVEHGMAVNLARPDLRRAYEVGTFPAADWRAEARRIADENANNLKRSMQSALLTTIAFVAVGFVMAVLLGKVNPSLPRDWGKILSVIGGFLAAWATLFELGGYSETFSGEALHELLHPVFFRAAFLPGLALATVGQLWWHAA